MTTDEKIAQSKEMYKDILKKLFEHCQKYNIDLVEASTIYSPCEECAKYQGRIYSISGNDKRFPKLPDWLKNDECLYNCGIRLSSYIEGIFEPTYIHGDIIEVSNRPFVDDRTEEQRAIFEKRKADILSEREDRAIYAQLINVIPDDAPKTFGSFRRMKNAKTKGYISLAEKAKNAGLEI